MIGSILQFRAGLWRWSWDPRFERIRIRVDEESVPVFNPRLRPAKAFREDLRGLFRQSGEEMAQIVWAAGASLPRGVAGCGDEMRQFLAAVALLGMRLADLPESWPPRRRLWVALRRSAKGQDWRQGREGLREVGRGLQRWAASNGFVEYANVGASDDVSYARRYELLRLVESGLARQASDAQGYGSALEGEELEAYWRIVRVRHAVAVEWLRVCPGSEEVLAKQAVADTTAGYLGMLIGESRRQHLEAFLNLLGTESEREVLRVLPKAQRDDHSTIRRRRIVGAWLLSRYSGSRAFRLLLPAKWQWGRWLAIGGFLTLSLVSIATAFDLTSLDLWTVPCFQALACLILIMGVPDVFQLLMPRALFGSMLGWLTMETIALGLSKDLLQEIHDVLNTMDLHRWDVRFEIIPALLVFGVVAYDIGERARGIPVWRCIGRSMGAFLVMALGSAYAGLVLSLHLAKQLEACFPATHTCGVYWGVLISGSLIALLLGMLLQLVWQDRSLAEPIRAIS